MQQLGSYVVSLTSVALITGILLTLIPEGTGKKILRLCCGIIMCTYALAPLSGLKIPDFINTAEDYLAQGNRIAEDGVSMAANKKSMLIKHGLETYILETTASMGADLTVQIQIDPEGRPLYVHLIGNVTDNLQEDISRMIANDLGISKEDQKWTNVQTNDTP